VMWARGWQTNDPDARLGSPSLDWRAWCGWRRRRRAAATKQWQRSCGSSIFGEDRGSADQRVARVAPMRSSGGPGMVGMTGNQAEGGARRRPHKSFSGE
jgi:hypothetical protein